MINKNTVKAQVCAITNLTSEEIESYDSFIDTAIASVSSALKEGASDSDNRIILLAAAIASYYITICFGCDGVTSFKAGDLSISKSENAATRAKALVEFAKADASSLLNDYGFDFRGV